VQALAFHGCTFPRSKHVLTLRLALHIHANTHIHTRAQTQTYTCTHTTGFGKSSSDVANRPFPSLVVDQDAIIKLLDKAQAATEEDFKEGKVFVKGVSVLHKYMDPVEVCRT